MKFINYLTSIAGVEIYPLISLFIFVLFFASVTFWAFSVSKKRLSAMSNIPFDQEPNSQQS